MTRERAIQSTLAGLFLVLLGVGILAGHYVAAKEFHTFNTVTGLVVVAVGLTLIIPREMKGALSTLATTFRSVWRKPPTP